VRRSRVSDAHDSIATRAGESLATDHADRASKNAQSQRKGAASLMRLVARALDEAQLPVGARLLLGVSGGRDSMALLHVLARLRTERGFELWAAGVDHGIRATARAELGLASALAAACNVPFARLDGSCDISANPQATARNLRYGLLRAEQARVAAEWLVTAHHADDRAETVLLRLVRSAPLRGLAVLQVRENSLLRPMVRARRAAVDAYVRKHKIDYADDPSNASIRYLRTQIRAEVLPALTALNPRIVEQLCDWADEASALPAPLSSAAEHGIERDHPRRAAALLEEAKSGGAGRARIWLRGDREARIDPTGAVVVTQRKKTAPEEK
jgi:tRNA(Ile)-lysidine synthetase-like protein